MRIFGHEVAILPSRLSLATRNARTQIRCDEALIEEAEALAARRRSRLSTDRIRLADNLRKEISAQAERVAKAETSRAKETLSISQQFERAIASLERAIQSLRNECSRQLAKIATAQNKRRDREGQDAAAAALALANFDAQIKAEAEAAAAAEAEAEE
jgi:hypothetical protein